MDITDILDGWPYEPGKVTARRVRGTDGEDKIQLRLDLGLLQMEVVGRPDGQRPHGHESLLDYYEDKLHQFEQANGNDKGFCLDERACELLRAESMMYYHRYLAEFVLEEYDAVDRDTRRNLHVMDFCRAYAQEESDRYILEQYRPYVLMMCFRSQGRKALAEDRPKAALAAIHKGVEEIESFYHRLDQGKAIAESGEIAILNAMAKEVESRIPVDPVQRLKERLDAAVDQEHYEEAALLRDRIHSAGQHAIKGWDQVEP